MGKLIWHKWYPRDWLSDPGLAMCEPATRGIWADAINIMLLQECPSLTGTLEQLSRVLHCRPIQLQAALCDIKEHNVGNVFEQNASKTSTNDQQTVNIIIECRRLVNVYKKKELRSKAGKESATKRQQRGQQTPQQTSVSVSVSASSEGECRGETLESSPSPSPSSITEEKDTALKPDRKAVELLAEVFECWNRLGTVPQVLVLSDKRRRALEIRLKDAFFAANWKPSLDKITASKFCRGENDRGWKANFDWFLQPDTVAKVMEGKYDGKEEKKVHPNVASGLWSQESVNRAKPW